MQQQKSFNECTLNFLDDTFGLEEIHRETQKGLLHWVEVAQEEEISDFERASLINIQELMDFNANIWNEQELNTSFIGPMFSIVRFSSTTFNLFAQRSLEGIVNGWKLYGFPDQILASGRRVPKVPYFAFAEYKKKLEPKGDPAAQALSAMLVAQSFNDDASVPLYGCYVIGNDWYFMTLEAKQYAFTKDYSAITDDIYDIFKLLRALKAIVAKRVELI